MSITPYLDSLNVDSETERVLGLALDMTRLALGIEDDLADKNYRQSNPPSCEGGRA
jgi:hypothetical protein